MKHCVEWDQRNQISHHFSLEVVPRGFGELSVGIQLIFGLVLEEKLSVKIYEKGRFDKIIDPFEVEDF